MSFNPADVALSGRHLIEASAGTGKTYSIANLFLRLLLEPHPSQTADEPLKIDQILVVTFTNAATDELRGRIRSKIELALHYFRGGNSSDSFIVEYGNCFLQNEHARGVACDRLYRALLLVDDAAIFTIHSFAARAIQTFLFETGALADVEVTIGGDDFRAGLISDLWREIQIASDDRVLNDTALASFEKFRRYLLSGKTGVLIPNIALESDRFSWEQADAQLRIHTEHLRNEVLSERQALQTRWETLKNDPSAMESVLREPVSGVEYGKFQLNKFITETDKWLSESTLVISPPSEKTAWGARYHAVSTGTAGAGTACHDFFLDLKAHLARCQGLDPEKMLFRAYLMAVARARLTRLNAAAMQPDDVIQLINNTLDNPETAQHLRRVLTAQYPVCMVDEFQDTDPEQFRLFDRLYQGDTALGLFAIGDPKQSIYAFRGADVFAYLDVKAGVPDDHVHSLDTNFRSKQGIMDGVNALFREPQQESGASPVFVFPGIEYEAVYSCENPPPGRGIAPQSKGVYRVGSQEPPSLVFIGNEAEQSDTFNNTVPVYAADCAERILSLLQGDQCATVEKKNAVIPVKPGDIAILVRDYSEADEMKMALAQKGLVAVYLAQKDSVFQQGLFSKDILFVLRAMDEPSNLHHLKAAFATPLLRHFKPSVARLASLDDDAGLEDAIRQFMAYAKCWHDKGIFAALTQLFTEQGLVESFTRRPDCDRLMTDFRHLSDLLQQQYQLTGSREQLIDWYASQLSDDSELDEDAKSLRLESDDNLIKIVTLHGCKGLEYPVVFIPFFFGFKDVDLAKNPPFYHREQEGQGWCAVLDFQQDKSAVEAIMCRERMAEDMRLLYVGITRAIYQCYIGISRSHRGSASNPLLAQSCWAHLLGLSQENASPDWPTLKALLQRRMQGTPCAYDSAMVMTNAVWDASAQEHTPLLEQLPDKMFPSSHWQVTSYSALAYQKDTRISAGSKQDESGVEVADERTTFMQKTDDTRWLADIRYRLRGSATTGDCLHKLFQRVAEGESLEDILDAELRAHGLTKPEGTLPAGLDAEAAIAQRRLDILDWLKTVMAVELGHGVPTLSALFATGHVLPECAFDFSLGTQGEAALQLADINAVLQRECGASAGVARKDQRKHINGIMTGSMDLLFIHDKKVYVLDYKSNTLGKAPRFYDHDSLHAAMRESRYDLQYLIYSVAAHRYMQQRLGARYAFDDGEYRYGGVFYLFLRGMGVPDYPDHGVYFVRPLQAQIEALDAAFAGKVVTHV